MTDYYPLLARAVAGRSDDERQAIYARARAALERQLRSFVPPLDEAEVSGELAAIETVFARIESEVAAASQAPEAGTASDAVSQAAAPDHVKPFEKDKEPDLSSPSHLEAEESLSAGAIGPASTEEPTVQPVIRPRVPTRSESKGGKKRLALFGGIAIALMIVVGGIAISRRDDPSRFSNQNAPPLVTAQPAGAPPEDGKTEGRLGGAEPVHPSQLPSTSTEPPARPPQVAQQPVPPTTGRAFMILEAPGGAAPNQYEGRANWVFGPDPTLKGQRSLRTKIEFSNAGLGVEISVARNTDAAISASHTLMVIFEPGAGVDPVREMSAIEWREGENQAGATLAGIVVPIADNVFMFGLDKAEAAVSRNLGLLRTQRWVVFEFRLSNGRRGAILAEKGADGEKAVADALNAWK